VAQGTARRRVPMPNQKVPASYLITAPLVRPRPGRAAQPSPESRARLARWSWAYFGLSFPAAVAPTIPMTVPTRSAVTSVIVVSPIILSSTG
jgi:hypothetical protein